MSTFDFCDILMHTLLTLPAFSSEHLCNGTVSVRRLAAGLLLSAGDRYR